MLTMDPYRLGSGTPLLNTPLATTPPYQPHAEAPLSATRTCYIVMVGDALTRSGLTFGSAVAYVIIA